LFRAILTKKEYRKKKTVAIILSIFLGILLFSEISLWAFLVQKINATDFQNPNGGVLIFDNSKLLSEKLKNNAQLFDFDNVIGPVELKFILKSDVNEVMKTMNIEDYEIDFDGGKCKGKETSIVKGVNPQNDSSLICIFDSVKTYRPSGIYNGIDKISRKSKSIPIIFPAINVTGVMKIRSPKQGDRSITYDATEIANL